MYAIRVEPGGRRLAITCSERLTTAEALRVTNHAAILCDAGKLNTITCDVRDVERGPGGTLAIAVTIAGNLRAGQKLGILMRDDQRTYVQRIVRFSGQASTVRAFTDEALMESWLSSGRDDYDLVRTPTGRHLELVTAGSGPASASARPGTRRAIG